MTNLIEKVAELRELATTDIPGKYTSCHLAQLIADLPEWMKRWLHWMRFARSKHERIT